MIYGVKMSARHFSTTSRPHYDIVVSGGGLVGGSFALAAKRSKLLANKTILMLESMKEPQKPRQHPKSQTGEFSNRVVALNDSTVTFLRNIRVWDEIERKNPVRGMRVWDETGGLFTHDEPDLFHVVENRAIVDSLRDKLDEDRCEVEVKYESTVEDVRQTDGECMIKLSNGDEIGAKLLVGADGFNSAVRKKAVKSVYMAKNYGQKGVVAVLHLDNSNNSNNYAWQLCLNDGPIAYLPLSHQRYVYMYSRYRLIRPPRASWFYYPGEFYVVSREDWSY